MARESRASRSRRLDLTHVRVVQIDEAFRETLGDLDEDEAWEREHFPERN